MRHLDDLVIGAPFDCGPVTAEAEEMTRFAARFMPHPFFLDPAAAQASLFGRLAASSLYELALCQGRAVRAIADVAVLCDLGFDAVAVTRPVYPGDRLLVRAWWSAVGRPVHTPQQGTATLTVEGVAADGAATIRFDARYLVARAAPARRTPTAA